MANNPTVVIGSLNDEELKKSIDKLVNHVDQQLNYMVSSTKVAVMSMNKSLKSLGDTKIDFGGSADGGASKRTKAQEEYTESVKKTTAETKRMGKETEMTFDQIATALSQARRTVSDFNTKRASGMLPSSEDYKKYEQALARIVEYNDKLKQSALAMADANQKAFAFDGKGLVKDFFSVDERLKQLNQHYKEEEKSSQKATAAIKENTQAKKENANVGQPAKSARDSYIAFMQGYKQQAEQIRRLMDEEQKAMQQRRQGVIDGFSKTIEERKARVKELSEEISKLYKERPDGYRDAIKQRTEEMNALKQKIRELTEAQKNLAESPIGASKRYLELEKEYNRIKNIMIDTTNVQRQSTQETEKQAQASKEYSEQVKKIAAEIRESAQWQKSDKFGFKRGMMNLDGRAYPVAENLEMGLRLEDQIVSVLQRANDERQKGIQITQQQAQSSRQVSEEDRKAMEALGWADSQQKRKYTPPMMNIERISEARGALQSITGMQEAWVDSINKTKSSYYQLSDYVKQLKNELIHLPKGVHDEAVKVLIREIQQAEREMQKFQQTMSRPVSLKDALGGSEKTLDDIAYKMRQLASYRSGLNIKTQANEIEQVNRKYAELQKSMNDIMRKNTEMIKSNTAVGRSWNYMKNRLAFYFTVGAGTQFVKNLIEVRSQYEMNERALGILINSAERGTQIFNELSQMALVSPYTLIELSTAAKQLTAYDIAAKDVVDTTRRLADMASAVGIPIERLTYALGQIKAYGYLNSRDARMFANAGIPLVKQLSDYYTQLEGRLVSTADVYDRIKKKTIDYEQVVQVINKMTDEGGKFFDFQAKMADTLKVRLANLTLAWNNMLNDMGSSNQGVLTTGIGLLRDMFLHWKDLESAIGKVAAAFGIYKAAQLVTLIWTGRITTAMGVQELVGKKLQARFASLTVAQKGFVSVATAGWAALAFVVADAWLTISRNMEEIEQLNKSIADGTKESYEAIDKMLHSSEMASTRLSAAQGKLSDTDAAKAWEMLREQIELSAASSKELIAQLLKEPDINKRVTESFNLAEKIEEANRKLSDLNDSLDVSQNSILGGLFGEGLAEDIDDYNARLKYTSDAAEWAAKKNKGFWENAAMGLRALFNEVKDTFGSDANEAQDEIKNFAQKAAQTIKDELGEEGIKDKIQVNEAIARVVRGMEQQFPQIRGKGKVLFETIFYDTMAKEFKGAVDGQAYYYEQFLEQLKKDHASAFSGVTEDINKETFKWSSAQIDAIQKTADKVKKDLPAASQGAIDEILRQLNSTDFKVRIVAEMATTSIDNVQKQFREKFIEKPWIADDKEREKEENEANQRYGTLMRKNTESNVEYEKRISDEKKTQLELSQKNADIISKNQEKEDEFSKAVLADAKKQKEIADDRLKAINEIENKGGYDFSTKSENAAANKAAKQAETELQKALKDELSTIDKVRSIYKDLTKEGMSHADAVERATRGWDETVNAINRVLQKNGLQKLDLSKFAGIENPRELVNMLQSQLNTLLKRGAKPAEIKELQTKVNTLEVDADKYDLTKITKGLNNELGKLKDEYELAVELDANPELGSIFADYMGIDLNELPKNAEEAAKKAQQYIDKILRENKSKEKIDIASLMGKDAFDKWVKTSGHNINDELVKIVANYRQTLHKIQVDESKKQMQEWDKLLEKYAEYEYKVTQIQKEAERERETARKKGASQEILDAIDERERQELARVSFEEFQKSPEWIVATGDLANMSKSAIGMLIEQLEKYKRSAKNLSPKQIKQLNSALSKLYKEQRKNNPFKAISNMLDEAKERMSTFDEEIKKTEEEIRKAEDAVNDAYEAGEDASKPMSVLAKLKEKWKNLKEEQQKAGEIDASSWVSAINETIGAVKSAIGVFDDLAKAIGGVNGNSDVDKVFSILEKAGEGAAIGAQIGGGWGALIGGVASAATGLISIFAGSENERITAKVKESERAVKRLELAYTDLEHAVDKAMGTAVIGAKQATLANKELQLAEIQRQITLEKSRDAKDRDEDKIIDLQKQYRELFYEIRDGYTEIVDDLMGTDVSSFAENLVSSMISAFKEGEDYMKVFSDKFDEMIDNMIMKSIVSRVVSSYMNRIWDDIDERINERSKDQAASYENAQREASRRAAMSDEEILEEIYKNSDKPLGFLFETINSPKNKKLIEEYRNAAKNEERAAKERLDAATMFADSDIDFVMSEISSVMPELGEKLKNILGEYYKFGESSDKNLSALQQGLQGVSEETAGAVEAYLNGMSQQAYLRNDLLTQIRDTIMSFDMDIQLGVFSQMLLQLQNNYMVMQSMQSMMENWTVPSGSGIRVELMS